MENLDQTLAQLLSNTQSFNYPFARPLVDKFKELLATDRIFEGGNEKCKEKGSNNQGNKLTMIADGVFNRLDDQFPINGGHSRPQNVPEVEDFIAFAEEFLAIFEKRQTEKPDSSMRIDFLELPARIHNKLIARRTNTVEDLLRLTPVNLRNTFTKGSLEIIKKCLNNKGFKWDK